MVCTWDSERSCWKASLDMEKGKHVNRPFCNKNLCFRLLNGPLFLAFWLHWLSKARESQRMYLEGTGRTPWQGSCHWPKIPFKQKHWDTFCNENVTEEESSWFACIHFTSLWQSYQVLQDMAGYKLKSSVPSNTCSRDDELGSWFLLGVWAAAPCFQHLR